MRAILSCGKSKVCIHDRYSATVHRLKDGTTTVEVRVTTYDDVIANWIFDRFNNDKLIDVELQRNDNKKLVIKDARILRLQPEVTSSIVAKLTTDLWADNCVVRKGSVGKPEITPEKVLFT